MIFHRESHAQPLSSPSVFCILPSWDHECYVCWAHSYSLFLTSFLPSVLSNSTIRVDLPGTSDRRDCQGPLIEVTARRSSQCMGMLLHPPPPQGRPPARSPASRCTLAPPHASCFWLGVAGVVMSDLVWCECVRVVVWLGSALLCSALLWLWCYRVWLWCYRVWSALHGMALCESVHTCAHQCISASIHPCMRTCVRASMHQCIHT